MKLIFLKPILVSIILTSGFNVLAMEPKPTHKKAKTAEEEYTGPEPMDPDYPYPGLLARPSEAQGRQDMPGTPLSSDEEAILLSAEGQEFILPLSAAKRSGTIASMLEMPNQESHIKFGEISTHSLATIVVLLIKLDKLILQEDQDTPKKEVYIPRAYQPFVNVLLHNLSNQEIALIFNAADFLDVPFILNGVAAVIADRIHKQIKENWNELSSAQRSELINQSPIPWSELTFAQRAELINQKLIPWSKLTFAQRSELINQTLIPWNIHTKQEYVLKQVTMRKKNIEQEYSIADYIAEHGQPQLAVVQPGEKSLELSEKKLTSLFGITSLQHAAQTEVLQLWGNCLFDLSLDPQGVISPFDEFVNLKSLILSRNELITIPDQLFVKLIHLRRLALSFNNFSYLQPGLFTESNNWQAIDITDSNLTYLPNGFFCGLTHLQILNLRNNLFSPEEEERIKKEVECEAPNAFIYF